MSDLGEIMAGIESKLTDAQCRAADAEALAQSRLDELAALEERFRVALAAAERHAEIAIALADEKNVYWQIAQTGEARAEVITKTEQLAAAERRAAELTAENESFEVGATAQRQRAELAESRLAAAARENEQANADIVVLTNLLDSVGRAAARENERLREENEAMERIVSAARKWAATDGQEYDHMDAEQELLLALAAEPWDGVQPQGGGE